MSLVRRLDVALSLVRFYFRIIPADWYKRFPFLPVPPRKYLSWRFQTAYGNRRPQLMTLLRDIWRFGGWLDEYKH